MRYYPIGNGTVSARIPKEFAALMESLQCVGADTDGLLALNTDEWKRLLDIADVAHLTLPLAQRLNPAFPEWVIERLSRNVRDNARRFERVYAAYREAAEALEKAGVPHIVLKGFTHVPEFVADPRMRMQSDIDIYCPPDTIEAGHEALKSLGYLPKLDVDYRWADHSPTMVRPGTWKWRGNSFDPEMPCSIELHFCLWNEKTSFMSVPEVEGFWKRRTEDKFGSFSWSSLQDVDKFAYLALHILRGIIAGDWVVHHVYELASFLQRRSRDVEFWNQWLITHSAQFRRVQAIGFWLARSWFSCQLPDSVAEVIEAIPAAQHEWLRRCGGTSLEGMFCMKREGRLLHFLLTGRGPARLVVLRRAFLPMSISGPKRAIVHFDRRAPRNSRETSVRGTYLRYLSSRFFAYLRSDIELLWHSTSMWLAGRKLSREFWTFLCACFFLIWACPSTISFSISF